MHGAIISCACFVAMGLVMDPCTGSAVASACEIVFRFGGFARGALVVHVHNGQQLRSAELITPSLRRCCVAADLFATRWDHSRKGRHTSSCSSLYFLLGSRGLWADFACTVWVMAAPSTSACSSGILLSTVASFITWFRAFSTAWLLSVASRPLFFRIIYNVECLASTFHFKNDSARVSHHIADGCMALRSLMIVL